jgi:hypothetical protein
MDTCISSSRTVKGDWSMQNRQEYFFDLFLYRAVSCLSLPTVKMSAQVLNHQGNSL